MGYTVALESSSGRMLGYAALVFILPCLLAIAAYFVFSHVTGSELYRSLSAVGGFAAGLVFAAIYSRFCVRGRADVTVTEIIAHAKDAADPTAEPENKTNLN